MKSKKQKIIDNAKNIFKKGSKTYFNSAQFFPADIRDDIFILYSFVRTADEFVDSIPQQPLKFYQLKNKFITAISGKSVNDLVIDSFVDLMKRNSIDQSMPLLFLNAMEQDLTKSKYKTLAELEQYMEGSAEMVGLMMAKIMCLPEISYPYAKLLGKSMQFINFIRDINHDLSLNRTYIPQNILNKYEFASLEQKLCSINPEQFEVMISELLGMYALWQSESEKGFHYIPKKYLIPIKTASDMYKWTASEIAKDPFIIYKKRIKPTKILILGTIKANQKLL